MIRIMQYILRFKKLCNTFSSINLHTLKWFYSYLYNIKQSVVIGVTKSDLKYVQASVPQGNISGQLSFLFNINVLMVHIDCKSKLFADDINFYN